MKFQIFPIQSAADGVAFRIFFSRLEKGATSSAAGKWNEGGWYASFREDVFPVSLVGQRIDGVGVVVTTPHTHGDKEADRFHLAGTCDNPGRVGNGTSTVHVL